MLSVALYARYSSDNQRDASIEDQLRLCRERAERHGARLLGARVLAATAVAARARGDERAARRRTVRANRAFDACGARGLVDGAADGPG